MRTIKSNYHTHTKRCNHACGDERDYINNAIQLGMDDFGFADHAPWVYDTGYVSSVRMKEDQLHDYVSTLINLKNEYKDKINIHIGLEAEYIPEKLEWLVKRCKEEGVEYLILGNHFYPSDDPTYMQYNYFGGCDSNGIDCYIQALQDAFKTGYYAYLAHPELFLRSYPMVDDVALKAFHCITDLALMYDVALEYNLSGYAFNKRTGVEMYPNDTFWKIAGKKGCKAIIGFDAHDPQFLLKMADIYRQSESLLRHYGCKVINTIEHTLKK